ncbi:MAG TPA: hypothetical protein VKH81_09530 [Candidatus Angelobacter sp.]|nr:hypothetical protein [Candidatus Angelobacter sp.]
MRRATAVGVSMEAVISSRVRRGIFFGVYGRLGTNPRCATAR